MTNEPTGKVRVVRCPKCWLLLPELADVPVYKCGGCGTVLQAKNKRNDGQSKISGLNAGRTNESIHISEDRESDNQNQDTTTPSLVNFVARNDLKDQTGHGVLNSEQTRLASFSVADRRYDVSDHSKPRGFNDEQLGEESLLSKDKENGRFENEIQASGGRWPRFFIGDEPAVSDLSAVERKNGRDQNECTARNGELPEDLYSRQSSSIENDKKGNNENEYGNCMREQPAYTNEVSSSSKLGLLENEEKSLVRAYSEVDENGNISSVTKSKSGFRLKDKNDSDSEKFSTDSLTAEGEAGLLVKIHGAVGRTNKTNTSLSDNSMSSPNEQVEQSHIHGPDSLRLQDTSANTEYVSSSSEFSGYIQDVYKSSTIGNFHAYNGSVSSYDGTAYQIPDRNSRPVKNSCEMENFFRSREALRRERYLKNNMKNDSFKIQGQAKKSFSVLLNKKHRAVEDSRWDSEPPRNHRLVREWKRWESGELYYGVPSDQQGDLSGYESGAPSNGLHQEFQRFSSIHSSDRSEYVERDRMRLLRKVYELEDQLYRKHFLQEKSNEGIPAEIHPLYSRRHARRTEGSNRIEQYDFPGMRYSGNASRAKHQVHHSCHCCPEGWHCISSFPLSLYHNNGVNPRSSCYRPCGSCSSSPQWYRGSGCSIRSCELQFGDQRSDNHGMMQHLKDNYRDVKRHFLPTAGGAPFITCYRCFNLLQLPGDFLLFKKKIHQLKCGCCEEILKFSLESRVHLVPYVQNDVNPLPSELDPCRAVLNKDDWGSPCRANDIPRLEPVTGSDDCGNHSCGNCSTEANSSGALQFLEDGIDDRNMWSTREQRFGSTQSQNIHEDPGETHAASRKSQPERIFSEIKRPPFRSSSPLHRLMGYSSPHALISGPGPSAAGAS